MAPWLGVPRVGCTLVLQTFFRVAWQAPATAAREKPRAVVFLKTQQPADCKHKGGALHPRQAVDLVRWPAAQPARGERVGFLS